jgi:hypothetical protein
MWPWGHAAVAYLLYAIFTQRQNSREPDSLAVLALGVGSQFPDLIDKPLGWSLSLLPGGRTLGHTVFFAMLVIPLVYFVASQYARGELATAFGIGYGSHLLSDLPPSVLTGNFEEATYLFWPVLEQPDYGPVDGIVDGFLRFSMGTYEWVQFALCFMALLIWFRDGKPGLEYVHGTVAWANPIQSTDDF